MFFQFTIKKGWFTFAKRVCKYPSRCLQIWSLSVAKNPKNQNLNKHINKGEN